MNASWLAASPPRRRFRGCAFARWKPKAWYFKWCRKCQTRRRVIPYRSDQECCRLCFTILLSLIHGRGRKSQGAPLRNYQCPRKPGYH